MNKLKRTVAALMLIAGLGAGGIVATAPAAEAHGTYYGPTSCGYSPGGQICWREVCHSNGYNWPFHSHWCETIWWYVFY